MWPSAMAGGFLSFRPSTRSISYSIVELVVAECGQDGLLSPQQKQKTKIEDSNPHLRDATPNNDVIVKPEVYREIS